MMIPNIMHMQLTTPLPPAAPEASLYMLSVECSRGGFYEAMYTATNGSCLHVCLFIVEVEEVRIAVIQGVFNNYRESFHFLVSVQGICSPRVYDYDYLTMTNSRNPIWHAVRRFIAYCGGDVGVANEKSLNLLSDTN